MKTKPSPKKLLGLLTLLCFMAVPTHAQFLKKLGQRAQRAAERTVENRVDRETTKKTDQALDSILEPGSADVGSAPSTGGAGSTPSSSGGNKASQTGPSGTSSGEPSLSVYSKFDFVPGDETLFFDDFSNDFVGDFPSKWDTNGSGEVVTLSGSSEKWFELKSQSTYFPNISSLPEDYTIEFDLLTVGVDQNTSSVALLSISLDENNSYDYYRAGKNGVNLKIPLVQYVVPHIGIWNKINDETIINNSVEAEIRNAIVHQPHISIAVNGQRLRLWVNQTKYVDVPKLVPPGQVLHYLRLFPDGLRDGEDRIFINNLKVAKGGVDLRRKLISEGKVSTNGILFDSGSANIKPGSMGIILQIAQVLQQEGAMKLKIVGHTDSDGDAQANVNLSKQRAEAVKKTLVDVYHIASSRLETDGKGESEPVAENNGPDGKAKNRRVEFVKI